MFIKLLIYFIYWGNGIPYFILYRKRSFLTRENDGPYFQYSKAATQKQNSEKSLIRLCLLQKINIKET